MSRKSWFLHLGLILAIFAADALTKNLAESLQSAMFLGPVGLVLNHNPGVIMGAFAGLPFFLRVVCLCTGGVFLALIYLSLQVLLLERVPFLRYGMTLLLAGILGNLTDRMRQGAVTDFLVLRFGDVSSPIVNLADLAQWVGVILLLAGLFLHPSRERNLRRRLWINPGFQARYILLLVGVALGYSVLSMVFFSTYISGMVQTLVTANSAELERQFLIPFFFTFAAMSAGFVVLLVVVGRVLSHRVAGPLFAFEEFLNGTLNGESRKLRLRAGDEFKHLEELADRLNDRLKKS